MASALARPPAAVVVEGESGIGKTRLVTELPSHPELHGRRFLVGGCRRIREPFPLGPLLEAVRGLGDALPAVPLSPVVGALRPLLPELTHLPPRPEPLDDRAAERHQLFRALAELLGSLGPVVLVLEDLHWSDEQTIDFLSYLLGDPPGDLSLVVTQRSEDTTAEVRALTAKLPAQVTRAAATLQPLDASQTGSLAAVLLGVERVPPEFAADLYALTSGSPYAIEELLTLLPQRIHMPHRVFDRPVRTSEQMRVVPFAPGAISLDAVHAARAGDPFTWELCTMCREGYTFVPSYFPVAGDGQYQSRGVVSLAMEMFTADGEPIPVTMAGGVLPSFVLPEQAGTYRLEHHDPLGGADTTWTFHSARPADDRTPEQYGCIGAIASLSLGPCQAEPLLSLRYDLGDRLQLDNTVPAPGAHRFRVTVLHHPAADLPRIAGLRLWTSTDGGENWERVRVLIPRDRGTDGEQTFDAVVFYPRLGETGGTVSLRAEAWDAAGNRVEQTIPDAFRLAGRG